MVYYTVAKICYHNFKHNKLILGHNRKDFWEISESIISKFSSIIDAGLILFNNMNLGRKLNHAIWNLNSNCYGSNHKKIYMIYRFLAFSSENLCNTTKQLKKASDATASWNFLVTEASKEVILLASSKFPTIIPLCTSYLLDDSIKEVFDAKVILFYAYSDFMEKSKVPLIIQ